MGLTLLQVDDAYTYCESSIQIQLFVSCVLLKENKFRHVTLQVV